MEMTSFHWDTDKCFKNLYFWYILVMDPYFVWDVVNLKMCQPKYCDKQLTPYSEELIKIWMEMCSFIQNLGLLPLVSNVPKINPTL